MTIWIAQLYDDLMNDFSASEFSNFQIERTVRLLNAVLDRDFRAFGYGLCDITSCCVNPKFACFEGYDAFLGNYKNYRIGHRDCRYCEFAKAFFLRNSFVIVSFEENGKRILKNVVGGYAKQRLKEDWWYDKLQKCYTNHLFEYAAFGLYKRSPRFWRDPGTTEVFGHEFELRFNSYEHKLEFAHAIKKNFRPCICEKDGSLDFGEAEGPSLELITPPWTYEQSIENVRAILNLAKECQVRESHAGYAWHVTFNLNAAPDPAHAGLRLFQLINHLDLRKWWETLARRRSETNPWTEKNYCKFEDWSRAEHLNVRMWAGRRSESPVDHYYATFLRRGDSAIEFRLLKSTVDFFCFSATLEVLKIAFAFVQTDFDVSRDNWLAFLKRNVSEKSVEYLQQQKLI